MSPVCFQLLFTRTSCANSASQSGQGFSKARKSWHSVLKLCQLDLKLAFAGVGSGCKNIEDEDGPVNDTDSYGILQISKLHEQPEPRAFPDWCVCQQQPGSFPRRRWQRLSVHAFCQQSYTLLPLALRQGIGLRKGIEDALDKSTILFCIRTRGEVERAGLFQRGTIL